MSTKNKTPTRVHRMAKRITVDDRVTGDLFLLATATTVVAGLAGWMAGNNQLGTVPFIASLAVMVVAWTGAFVTLGAIAVVAAIRKSHKGTCQLLEAQMEHYSTRVQRDIRSALQHSELSAYLTAVEDTHHETGPRLGIVKNNG